MFNNLPLFIAGLDTTTSVCLILCVLSVCAFEFVNGFHDTANAVATVIYTKSLKPQIAVMWSGLWNFLGVWYGPGGIAVAMGVIKLLPLNDMISADVYANVSIVLAVLITAIAWNLGTWYFGIPCSSSHTLIGSLLGAAFAYGMIHGGDGVNWDKAKEIGMSLLMSPAFGLAVAIGLMFLLKVLIKNKALFEAPQEGKKTPLWIRGVLITTCTAVSFFHGSNDGQKGVGLMLVILIAFMPMQFAINPDMTTEKINTSLAKIETALTASASQNAAYSTELTNLANNAKQLREENVGSATPTKEELVKLRKRIQKLNKDLKNLQKEEGVLPKNQAKEIKSASKALAVSYEFAPNWIIVMISVCLGLGTMIGWKRIVVTIGEKIGKSHLTYAQGASAELVAAGTIGLSTGFGLPVSTTHVLSSGVAGAMIASGGTKNLQKSTIINIALAWVLTLPVTVIVSCALVYLFDLIF